MLSLITKAYYLLTVPISVVFILQSASIHPAYRMTWLKKLQLGFRMFLNKCWRRDCLHMSWQDCVRPERRPSLRTA
jgi:hypothetical protein